MRAVGVFYKEGETNLPKQQYQNSEYFEVNNLVYISNTPYNSGVEELIRLKAIINNGDFDIQIW